MSSLLSVVQPSSPSPKPLADGCRHVYLDFGSNIGIQFRKLYSPDEYPLAQIRGKFDQYFGPGKREDVCAWGWEPNPRHLKSLKRLQEAYRALGRRLTINTVAAAGALDGVGVFLSDNDVRNNDWGSKVELLPKGVPEPDDAIQVMNVAAWILTNVVHRRVPTDVSDSALPPSIVAKIDIEGSDENVFFAMISNGVLCSIDYIYTEAHVRSDVIKFMKVGLAAVGCPTEIEWMDDETYRNGMWKDPKRRLRLRRV